MRIYNGDHSLSVAQLTLYQEGMGPFMARVEDVAQKRLDSDSKLHYMSPEVVHRELLQELDR